MAERRPRGSAPYTRKYTNGTWGGQYRDADGKKRWTGGHKTQRIAERAAIQLGDQAREERDQRDHEHGDDGLTFRVFYLEHYAPTRLVESTTARNDRYRLGRLFAQWGDVPLHGIARRAVQTWVLDLAREPRKADDEDSAPLAPATVRKHYNDLSAALRGAVEEGLLEHSPCQAIKLPTIPPAAHRYLTDREVDAILHALDGWRLLLAELLLDAGLRMGEATGLHRHRLHLDDADDPYVTIVETYDPDNHVVKPYPKGKARRDVPLSHRVADRLRRWITGHPAAASCGVRHADRTTCRHDLLLRNDAGAPINRHNFARDVWGPARDLAATRPPETGADSDRPHAPEVGDARPHDLRHTFASRAISAGVSLERLQVLMGHKSYTTTLSYAHLMDDDRENVRTLLAARAARVKGQAKGQTGDGTRRQTTEDDTPEQARDLQR